MNQAGDHPVPSYGSYLRLETLLKAQDPPDYARLRPGDPPGKATRELAHHDELLFIVVHQVYELWFKLVLHEVSAARDYLGRLRPEPRPPVVAESTIPVIVAGLQRVAEVFRIGIDHFRLIETMPPQNFLHFRDLIIPASGFQSVQFRELEILAGLPESMRMDFEGVPYESKLTDEERARLEQRRGEMTLKDALYDWLERTPIERFFPGFAEAFTLAFGEYADEQAAFQDANPNLAPSQRRAARASFEAQKKALHAWLFGGDEKQNKAHQAFLFLATYRETPLLRWPSQLVDTLVEFEQAFRIFRFRHARMVERMIGLRVGSGGSLGVRYLDRTTLKYKIFGDLLEARSYLLSPERVPALPDPTGLDFRYEP